MVIFIINSRQEVYLHPEQLIETYRMDVKTGDYRVITPASQERYLHSSGFRTCRGFALYFPKQNTALLAHLQRTQSLDGILESVATQELTDIRGESCEFTMLSGINGGNRCMEELKKVANYFPKAKPFPHNNPARVVDTMMIDKQTGNVIYGWDANCPII